MSVSAPEAVPARKPTPIVPRDTIIGRALLAVIAIMTFLSALTVGTVELVRDVASEWHSDMAREVTIQVRPVAGANIDAEILKALNAVRAVPGVTDARALSRQETSELLEPWLGGGVDLAALPVPRLVVARIEPGSTPDLAGLRASLSEAVAGASLDDHRAWQDRLAGVSGTIMLAGLTVLFLMLAATILAVSFATRGAVASKRAIVEVLHFVGASDFYIAGAFQRHFLTVGLKGGVTGGGAAAALFALGTALPGVLGWLPGGEETAYLLGEYSLGRQGYAGIAGVVVLVAVITALTSRYTVRWTLREID